MSEIDRTADEWEQYLKQHPDMVLMHVDGEGRIHEFEHDEEKGHLAFWAGSRGYDYNGSRTALVAATKGTLKPVPREDVQAERDRLANGHYETAEEWVKDTKTSHIPE